MAYIFNDENAKQAIESGKPVVIDFWAEWCGPCRHIGPFVEELAEEFEGRVLIGKYDVDEGDDLPVDYGIRSIPTILFFKDGELKNRHVGSASKDDLKKKIEELL
ncbi:MAG: thioredoxin [Bacteroidales bacterium]|nr:thioredoxin [Bacteroidales bacterium]